MLVDAYRRLPFDNQLDSIKGFGEVTAVGREARKKRRLRLLRHGCRALVKQTRRPRATRIRQCRRGKWSARPSASQRPLTVTQPCHTRPAHPCHTMLVTYLCHKRTGV